jgi:hypothetical protein
MRVRRATDIAISECLFCRPWPFSFRAIRGTTFKSTRDTIRRALPGQQGQSRLCSSSRLHFLFRLLLVWKGAGLSRVELAGWAQRRSDLSLDRVPHEHSAYRAKTPWVSKPDYSGPTLIRGRRLDEERGSRLRFTSSGSKINERLELDAPSPEKEPAHWSFWPTSMYVPGPGCYSVQIDTAQGTDVVIFGTTAATQSSAPSATVPPTGDVKAPLYNPGGK